MAKTAPACEPAQVRLAPMRWGNYTLVQLIQLEKLAYGVDYLKNEVYFRATLSRILFIVIALTLFNVVLSRNQPDDLGKNLILFISISLVVYVLGSRYRIKDGTLTFYSIFLPKRNIKITDIKYIEAIERRRLLQVTIYQGSSLKEDEYKIHTSDGQKYTIGTEYVNDQKLTVGQYLNRKYKIPLREKEVIVYTGS